jgi:phospholipase/carboxylesterase
MSEPIRLKANRLAPASGGAPRQLVVLLHGGGADCNDLIGLAQPWSRLLPDAAFVSPNAPFRCDFSPTGYQWFGLGRMSAEELVAGVREAAPILDRFLDEELDRHGLTDDRLALVGFSQGTMMSLQVALRRPQACAGILGYAGLLADRETLAAELRSRPPVMLLHGTMDPLIPFAMMEQAAESLTALGMLVETCAMEGTGHGIDEAGVDHGGQFLARVLDSKGA